MADDRQLKINKCYYSIYKRIKILSNEGRKWGDVTIPFFNKEQQIEHIQGRTILSNGKIIPLDNSKIFEKDIFVSDEIKIFKESAKSGSVLAQSALAYCYEKGIGVVPDKPEAVELYRKAAQRGNMAAYNSLKRMYDEIRPPNKEFAIYEN